MGISSKEGDGGSTDFFFTDRSGTIQTRRTPKNAPSMEFIGTLDELDAFLAITELTLRSNGSRNFADLITEVRKGIVFAMMVQPLKITQHLTWLQLQIKILEKEKPAGDFIQRWTNTNAACLNAARTIIRRTERSLIAAAEKNNAELQDCTEPDWEALFPWINRLSDLFFLMAATEERKDC